MSKGLLLVISGFSGAGKGTVMKRLLELHDEYSLSISATTRKPREGEADGREYFFKTVEEFEKMIAEDALIEHAQYVGNYYGTPKKSVLDLIERGKSVLLEIDIQGAMQVKERYPKGVFIYIVPPSLRTLSARLHGRGTDSEDTIQKRLAQITGELSMAHKYDYIVVNDVLKDAVHKTCAIIEAERCKLSRNQNQIETIFQQYINKEVPLK